MGLTKYVFLFPCVALLSFVEPAGNINHSCPNLLALFNDKWFGTEPYSGIHIRHQEDTNCGQSCQIRVHRSNILNESYTLVLSQVGKCRYAENIEVYFHGESESIQLVKEWFHLLSKVLFDPEFGLFKYTTEGDYYLEINSLSGVQRVDHLYYFQFIGILAALAVSHGYVLSANLPRLFFKQVLQKPILLKDLREIDPQCYKSLLYIEEHDPRDVGCLTFCISDNKGECHELKPGGSKIEVTEQNKLEYIDLVTQWRSVNRVQDQMSSFRRGFNCIISQDKILPFDEQELRYLVCGVDIIDVDDWKKNTDYTMCDENSRIVKFFWKVVSSYNNKMRSALLLFVTGTARLPVNGFRGIRPRFQIYSTNERNSLPRSQICFNRLILPDYKSYEEVKNKLNFAIENTDQLLRG